MKDFAHGASWRKERVIGWEGFWLLMAMVVPMCIYIVIAK